MKLSPSASKWAAIAIICAGVISNLQADTAKVIRLKGAAQYSSGNKVWRPLHVGDVLKPGTVIQTASESTVDIVLGNEDETPAATPIIRRFNYTSQDAQQNIVRLRENTVLALDKVNFEQTGADVVTDIQLDLRSGRIFGNVKKLYAASRFEVKLPNGVAGIRGTLFDLSANGILTVFFGSVVISYYDNNNILVTKTVNAGWTLDLSNGNLTQLLAGAHGDDDLPPGETPPPTYITVDHTVTPISPILPGDFHITQTPPQQP